MLLELAENELTEKIIGLALKIHSRVGPGLLESAYEEMLCYELTKAGLSFQRQVQVPIEYEGIRLDAGFRSDLIIEKKIILELKSVEKLNPVHSKQLMTYLRLSGLKVGLLINFHVPLLKNGIERVLNGF